VVYTTENLPASAEFAKRKSYGTAQKQAKKAIRFLKVIAEGFIATGARCQPLTGAKG
jgi:hypothetical protein